MSTQEDEKKTSKSPEDAGAETDRENQEVAEIARRPSVARSPVNRPGSPTPDDSTRVVAETRSSPAATPQDQERVPSPAVTHDQPQATNDLPRMSPVGDQAKSPSPVLMQRRSPTDEQSASRRESPVATDEKPPSRLSAASKEQPGSKAASPTASRRSSDHVQEPIHTTASPPSSPKINQLVTANPVLEDQARRSSTVKRASPTPSQDSREKVLDGEPVHPPPSRRESQVKGADTKSPR